MRYLALAIIVAACAAGPQRATLPSGSATPAHDLAEASTAASRGSAAGTHASPCEPSHDPARAKQDPCSDPRVVDRTALPSGSAASPGRAGLVDLDIIRITARATAPGGEPELTSVASADLFRQANEAVKAGRQREALTAYRQLVGEFPDSQFAALALFDIAAVYDAQGDVAATLAALTELVAKYPDARESIDGHLYIAALQADHHQWAAAAATLSAVLARPNLTFGDRIEAFARRGYVELEQHLYDAADASLAGAIAEWRTAPRIEDPYYIAMAHYYRGELMHRRFTEAPVRTGDDEMVADLDAKRALAAQAYDRWRESLRFKHAYWATASGYQMSQIFVELWDAHVRAPYPQRIEPATRPTYVADVHARVRDDLQKALEGHRMNVELAKAYGIDTQWSKASAQQAVTIMDLLAKDTAGSYVTPSH